MPPTIRAWREASAEQKLAITTIALEELCMAQALVMIHGTQRAGQRYVEVGGHVRFDDLGNPVVFHDGEWWGLG